MWCKRPGDGDCLVRGRSCDERFFVCNGHGLLGFFDESVFYVSVGLCPFVEVFID